MNQYQKLGFTDTGSHLEMQVIFIYLFMTFNYFSAAIPFLSFFTFFRPEDELELVYETPDDVFFLQI